MAGGATCFADWCKVTDESVRIVAVELRCDGSTGFKLVAAGAILCCVVDERIISNHLRPLTLPSPRRPARGY